LCAPSSSSSSSAWWGTWLTLPPLAATARLRNRWKSTPTKWSPIPVSLGAAVLVVLTLYKQASDKGKEPLPDGSVKMQGPWQVRPRSLLLLVSTRL